MRSTLKICFAFSVEIAIMNLTNLHVKHIRYIKYIVLKYQKTFTMIYVRMYTTFRELALFIFGPMPKIVTSITFNYIFCASLVIFPLQTEQTK